MEVNNVNTGNLGKVSHEQHGITSRTRTIMPNRGDESQNGSSAAITKNDMKNLAESLNVAARSINRRVSFSYHEKTHRVIMKVMDAENQEVIREIPPKEMVKLYEHIHELIGMFVDESR